MPFYNFVVDSFHKKKLCSRLLQTNCDFSSKTAVLRFWVFLKGLRGTYDVHLRLIGKRVVHFLLVLIELFARCYCFVATSEYRLKIGDFASVGAGRPKISGRRGIHTNHSPSKKIMLSDLSYGVKIWTDLSSILSQCTRLTDGQAGRTEGRTDRQTDRGLSPDYTALHSMRRGKNPSLDPCD